MDGIGAMTNSIARAAQFCDCLMETANAQGISSIEEAVILVIEYTGIELGRNRNNQAPDELVIAAKLIEKAFANAKSSSAKSDAKLIQFPTGGLVEKSPLRGTCI